MRVAPIVCVLTWSALSFADNPLPPPSEIVHWSSNRRYVAVADPKRDAVTTTTGASASASMGLAPSR